MTTKTSTITRIWHGETLPEHGDKYFAVLKDTGIQEYINTKGVRTVKILREDKVDSSHFCIITEWNDLESLISFTGGRVKDAKYYKEDDEYLLEKEKEVLNLRCFPVFGGLKNYAELLDSLFKGGNWVDVSFQEVLKNISYEAAVERRISSRHTIYEIVHHVIQWRLFLLTRLKRKKDPKYPISNDTDWLERQHLNASDWENLKIQFKVFQQELVVYLGQFDDQLLEEKVPERQYDYRYLINGIIQHDYYHLGQIVILS